jgi:hypothetical protein
MPEPTIIIAIEAVSKTLDLLKNLETLIDKFSAVSKKEAIELAAALDEVHKQLEAVFDLTEQYRRLAFQRDFAQDAPPVLAMLEGPKARVRVQHSGGSCQIIDNIYTKHLKGWFNSAKADEIFAVLSDADQQLFYQMEQVCEYIGKEARDVNDTIANGQVAAAYDRVQTGQKALQGIDSALAQAMLVLLRVRNEALKRSGVTSLRPASSAP